MQHKIVRVWRDGFKGRKMTFSSDIDFNGEYLRVTTSGTLDSVGEVEQYVDLIRQEALKCETNKVLLDERGLMEQQDTHDAYEVSESEVASLTALAGIRISSVCHPNNYELNKTYETFLMNRSLLFRVFLKEADALSWLND